MSKIPAIFAEEKESKVATLSTEERLPQKAVKKASDFGIDLDIISAELALLDAGQNMSE